MRDWTRVKPHLPPFDGGWIRFADDGVAEAFYAEEDSALGLPEGSVQPATEAARVAFLQWEEFVPNPHLVRTPFGVCTPQELAAAERAAAARA